MISSPRTKSDRIELTEDAAQPVERVITYLEMRARTELHPKTVSDPNFSIQRVSLPQWEFNRFLYAFVGKRWNWTDKNAWSGEQWRVYAESAHLQTFVAYYAGSIAGYFEIERQPAGDLEINYLGLSEHFIGRGFGGVLLTRAVEEAWKRDASRVWLHTCTLDHPAALQNYLARGFKVYKTEHKRETLHPS